MLIYANFNLIIVFALHLKKKKKDPFKTTIRVKSKF